jgi:hypothetical protein
LNERQYSIDISAFRRTRHDYIEPGTGDWFSVVAKLTELLQRKV